jgi:hypothetical protein
LSLFPTILGSAYPFGAYGYGPLAQQVDAAPDPLEQAKPSEPAPRSQYATYTAGIGGFDKAPPGTPALYMQMRKYSALRLAFAVACGPIFAGTRTLEICKQDGTPAKQRKGPKLDDEADSPEDKAKTDLEEHFKDLWTDILNGLECLNFGWWLQEVQWGRAKALTLPVRFKDFLPWEATLLRDPFGDFAGYRMQANGKPEDDRSPAYAFHAVCEPHLDRLHGVPRAEYARELWWRAIQSDLNGDRMERKASGISLLALIANGASFTDANNQPVLPEAAFQSVFNALSTGGGGMITGSPLMKSDLIKNPDLFEKLPTMKVTQFDWGSTAPSILAQLARQDAIDKRIMRAWNRPEREALEGQHGTKAEAGTHGAIGVLDSEKIHSDFLRQFNRGPFNTTLVTNFGPDWKGRLYWKATPLADDSKTFLQDIAKALAANPVDTFGQQIDRKALAEKTELPVDENFDPTKIPALPESPPADTNAGGNGDPLARRNGNGKAAA